MNLVTITESANQHLSEIVAKNNAQGVLLGVRGGGCAGFSYEWELLEEIPATFNPEDKLSLHKGKLCVQPEAVMFVLNTIVDLVDDIAGRYLKIVNPNATSQCGCGESFSV